MLTLWRCKFFLEWSMTSKVNQGHKRRPFYLKIHFYFNIFFVLFVLLIDWRNKCCWTLFKKKGNIRHEQRQHLFCTKNTFVLYKDDIYIVQRRHLHWTKTTFNLYKSTFTLYKSTFNLYKDDIGLAYVKCTFYLKMQYFSRLNMAYGHIGTL